MSQPNLKSQFEEAFEKSSVPHSPKFLPQRSGTFSETTCSTTLATFGKNSSKTHDWFDAKSSEMRPVIEAKRTALMEFKQSPSERNLQIIRAARNKVQQTTRRRANEYWAQPGYTDSRHRREHQDFLYDGNKKALDPTQSKTTPSKPLLGDNQRQRQADGEMGRPLF